MRITKKSKFLTYTTKKTDSQKILLTYRNKHFKNVIRYVIIIIDRYLLQKIGAQKND